MRHGNGTLKAAVKRKCPKKKTGKESKKKK